MKTFIFFCVIAAAWAVREPFKNTCTEKPDSGRCLAYIPMYYYDPETGTCKKFIYGGCGGNGNRYPNEEACLENCAVLDSYDCDKPAETGMCKAYIPRYYYDKVDGKCKKFVYGGCGGNRNNFGSEEECYNRCEVPVAAKAPSFCSLKPEGGRCRAYFPMYYYDPETKSCKEFVYGGCDGNDNSFDTEEECLEVCSA